MKPGIYKRGEIDYFSVDAVNISTLKEIAKSPLHYRHLRKHGREPTNQMKLGTSAHTAVLEPDRFMLDYAMFVPPKCEKTGKQKSSNRGTNAWKEFETAHPGKTVIKRDEYMTAIATRDAVRGNKLATKYLEQGMPEPTLVWIDKETGMLCKGRIDWDSQGLGIVDIKTGADIGLWAFQKTTARLKYHVQLAFYSDGYEAATGKRPGVTIIAVEQKPPHDVVVYNVPEETLEAGREEYRTMLGTLQVCLKNGHWPGQTEEELDLTLPSWALRGDQETELELTIGGETLVM